MNVKEVYKLLPALYLSYIEKDLSGQMAESFRDIFIARDIKLPSHTQVGKFSIWHHDE